MPQASTSPGSTPLRGYLLVMLAATLWGLIGPVAKLAFAAGMGPVEVAFWRTMMGWSFFAIHAVARRDVRIQRRDAPMILAFGVVGIAGLFGCNIMAVDLGGAAMAAVLLYTAPAWVAIMSRILLAEPMTRAKLLALALTLLGVAGVSFGPRLQGGADMAGLTPLAIGIGLASGFSYALYYIFGKIFLGRYRTHTLFLYAMPVGGLTLLPFCHFGPHPWQAWLACIVIAVCSTYGAYTLYYAGLKHLEATRAALVATMEPVVAAVLAFMWWDERFSTFGYVGSVLILAGVLATMLEKDERRRLTSEAVQRST